VRENGLGIVTLVVFLVIWFGQSVTGHHVFNDDQREHHEHTVSYGDYLRTAHFGEATFENWESEFLQMGGYVLLTVWLVQKGSPESKPIDGSDPTDEDPEDHRKDPDAPWPVRRGGVWLKLYENSLASAFLALFAASFLLHAWSGSRAASQEAVAHGGAPIGFVEFLGSAQMWFQSLQNWQSEFLAVFSIVVLSIFLRQKGSPESKPVHAPMAKTGS
jgi:hypothetical protein